MKKFFKRIGRGIKKLGKKIAKGFKTAFKSVGKFFSKLGPLGSMGLMFIAPYLLAPLKAGMGAASGLGATGQTVAGAGAKSVAASKAAVLGSKSGISKAVASTMFEVGKSFGTVSKTITGGIEGVLNTLGGGNFTANSITGASGQGVQIGSKINQGINDFFGRVDKTASGKSPMDAGAVERDMLRETQIKPSETDMKFFEEGPPEIPKVDLKPQADFGLKKTSFTNPIQTDADFFAPDPVDAGLETNVKEAITKSVSDKKMRDSLLSVKGRVTDYVSELPSNFVQKPFSTLADVSSKVSLVQQAANWISPDDLPYSGGGSTAKYLAESNLLQGNIDYVNMMPDQLGDQELVHTALLPESSTLDATVYDVLGRNMYYAFA